MKIGLAQTRPVTGDIRANLESHRALLELAAASAVDVVVFPELSLTGYEPALAGDLAVHSSDSRFDVLQEIADKHTVVICAGAPLRGGEGGVHIGLVIFQPHTARTVYCKQHLHPDEYPFFVPGLPSAGMIGDEAALAICYETAVPEHASNARKSGARHYVASAVKFVKDMERATARMAAIAREHGMTTLVANCVGTCDGQPCGGGTAAWDRDGTLVAQLNERDEGVLVFDTGTRQAIIRYREVAGTLERAPE